MKANHFQIWSFFVLGCIRSALLLIVGVFRIIDPAFFTYQSFLLSTAILFLYALVLWQSWSRALFTTVIFPIYWGTVLFVAVAINVILKLNGTLLMKTTEQNGGPNDIGAVHLADFMIHQWPWVEILLFTWFQWPLLIHHFSTLYDQLSNPERAGYVLYVLLIPGGILGFYMLNFDFLGNYPTPLPFWLLVLLVILISLLIQAVLFMLFYFQMPAKTKLKAV